MDDLRPVAWSLRGVGEFDPRWAKSAKRFQSLIVDNGAGECSGWNGRIDAAGYARFGDGSILGTVFAHLISFRLGGGFCPEGYEVDHSCHSSDKSCKKGVHCPHRHCTTFAHLQAIPLKQNRDARRYADPVIECAQGHPYDEQNTYINSKTGKRACRECVRLATRRWLEKDGNRERQNGIRGQQRRRLG